MFALQPQDADGLDLTYLRRVDIQISGFAFVYGLDGSSPAGGSPVPELESQFPGIRSVLLESHLRFTFMRFGVPYAVSIECFDGAARMRRLSCREASKVAVRFLKALTIAGGAPADKPAAAPHTVERPEQTSADFTYYPPGDILPGSGVRRQTGRPDATVYSRIRFPIAQAPAYINSQAFMNWGNCDFTGRVRLGGEGKEASYRCRVNGVPLFHDETKNYAYPWRDNFCEHRSFYVTQRPAGMGHQGEDIRAGLCKLRNEAADRCEPERHDVVAACDGMVLRNPGDEALYLLVNAPGEHIRFRYLHMNPKALDAAGLVSGRAVAEGDVLGAVGAYGRHGGGTTYHLHFDVQVPTRQGWVFVNPYMTLVASYERLIGGRGRLMQPEKLANTANGASTSSPESLLAVSPGEVTAVPASKLSAMSPPERAPAPSPAASDAIVVPEPRPRPQRAADDSESRSEPKNDERETAGNGHCTTHVAKSHRRRDCDEDAAENRERAKRTHSVR